MRLAGPKNFCLAGAPSNIASPDSILAFFQVADMVKQRHRNIPCSKLALSSLIYQAPGKVQREMRDRSCHAKWHTWSHRQRFFVVNRKSIAKYLEFCLRNVTIASSHPHYWVRLGGGAVSKACPSLPGPPPLVHEHSSFLPSDTKTNTQFCSET